jgi:hypothetical protein
LTTLTGCASWNARWGAFLQACADEHALKAEEAQDRLEALKAELEAERKAIRRERELDLAALRAENEKRDCKNKSQFEESVRTKIGLDVDHQLSLGQLQVNVEELKKLLEQREKEAEALKQMPQLPLVQPYCCPSCGAPGPRCGCPNQPPEQALNQADCAGTYPFGQQPLMQPLKQKPILPTEIPLMLPVRMKMAIQGPRLEESKVRLTPRPGRQPLRPLKEKKPCGQCPQCLEGMPCGGCVPNCDAPMPQPYPEPSDLFGSRPAADRVAERPLREPESIPGQDSDADSDAEPVPETEMIPEPKDEARRKTPKPTATVKAHEMVMTAKPVAPK